MSPPPPSVVVEFIGGPLDGERPALPVEIPPVDVEVTVTSTMTGILGDEVPMPTRRGSYRRRANRDPSGPAWLYDYLGDGAPPS